MEPLTQGSGHPRRQLAGPRCRRRAPAAALALTALALASGGCFDLFKPAEPEPPSTGGGTVNVELDYSGPTAVLSTLAAAVKAKAGANGTVAYMGAFADSAADGIPLVVEFDPGVADLWSARAGGLPAWTRVLEQQFYAYLARLNPDEFTMQWSTYSGAPSDDEDANASEATLYRQYQVYATSEDGSTVSIARGRADLVFRRLSETRWALYRWVDTIDPAVGADPADAGLRCFSRLRLDSTGR